MPNLPVSHTIQALQLADQLVQSVTRADGQWPDPADVASQAEYATYLRELSAVVWPTRSAQPSATPICTVYFCSTLYW